MMPVAGSIVRPGGRPVAENVSLSPVSTSENWSEISTGMMAWPSLLAWSSSVTSGLRIGVSLVPVMVTVRVAVLVPPSPSETV
ncbi:hypothetical protein D3C87_1371890 [compost metagenome]